MNVLVLNAKIFSNIVPKIKDNEEIPFRKNLKLELIS